MYTKQQTLYKYLFLVIFVCHIVFTTTVDARRVFLNAKF
jgi:hypothetical protein